MSRRRLSTLAEIFGTSRQSGEAAKVGEVHSSRRTRARASLKVGACFGYQRTHAGRRRCVASVCVAQSVTSENKPSSAGVVRRMARSDHCRWVSRPRCRRASSKVVSVRQRRTNQRRMSAGSAFKSVQRKACGSFSPLGSRTSTQRIATRRPGGCQSAVPEARSSRRVLRPYQPSMLTRRQGVRRLRRHSARLGSRAPVTAERPRCRGRRGGGGSHRQASRRRRVTTVRCGVRARSKAMAEKLLSATAMTRFCQNSRQTRRREVKAEFSLRCFENSEHTAGTTQVKQTAAAGRDVLLVAGGKGGGGGGRL